LVAGFLVVGLAVLLDGLAAGRTSFQIIGTIIFVGGIALFVAKVAEEIHPVTEQWDITGEHGEVVQDVGGKTKGIVRVRSELWSARSASPIATGSKVRVTKVEGLQVWVERLVADSSTN